MQKPEPQELLLQALSTGRLDQVRHQINCLHPSEIADLLEGLPTNDREAVWSQVSFELTGEVLSHTQDSIRVGLMRQMHPDELAKVTMSLEADDLADILNDLPENVVDNVLLSMDEQRRRRLESVLSYPEDTAGGLMNPDIVSVRPDVSLDVVSRYLRQRGKLPEQIANLIVVDRKNTYLGVLRLSDLLTNNPDDNVSEYVISEINFPVDTPARDVAKAFEQRDLLSAAVVDNDGKLLGNITVDDVLDVIQEQAEHAVRSMAGLADHDIFEPLLTGAKRRAIWLGINLSAAFLASYVVGRFEETIEELVALAILMPIVASMGGVAGSQSLNITIRGLAAGHITRVNSRILINKEVGLGLLNGATWACVVGFITIIWFDSYALGGVISLAMVLNLFVASFSGVMIPLTLKKIGIDPAIAGGVLLITVTDVVGFGTFLGLAALFLGT